MIVDPECDVPGTSERTWKRPMPMAVFHERFSSEVVVARASASIRTSPAKWRPTRGEAAARAFLLFSRMMKTMP